MSQVQRRIWEWLSEAAIVSIAAIFVWEVGPLYCVHRISRVSEDSYMLGGGSLRHEAHLVDVRSLIPRPRQDVGPIAGEAGLDVEGGR
jgi:hypothetical protein